MIPISLKDYIEQHEFKDKITEAGVFIFFDGLVPDFGIYKSKNILNGVQLVISGDFLFCDILYNICISFADEKLPLSISE